MKKSFLLLLLIPFLGTAQFNNLLKKAADQASILTKSNSSLDIAAGLKEALNKGVTEQVSKLTKTDGFYKNEAIKILIPEELIKVDRTLRKMGMSSLADDGIRALNRAAEDAVREATPIFVDAIKKITITDAKSILMGSDNAATAYLQSSTFSPLYSKFSPVVQTSIGKVGADVIWASLISKYNTLPLVQKVNPDITDYVTNKALDGVFKMIAVEEKNIRTDLNSRTSDVLKKVFALQDKK
ncbi:DUF4197 domain-containing protein [Flavobacterium cellulosilyticum]|uniref:DUF4197 domain-containing protein n=1 Tax=Flavobacterium cellulosilyticum TaxID=2541731 RepID=A0A4R5CDM1_9FLAO|nr:DUF4197 domain-containing protein [Flavobacterium cellulosilyticum]TDD95274.1 DUF4197 domain-containing protein [Flavobacterium cellulosilyticum]